MSKYVVDTFQDKCHIRLDGLSDLDFNYPCGSYVVLQARLLGLSYASYLRFVRDHYGASLKGKDGTYVSVYFPIKNKDGAKAFCKILNERLEEAVKYRKEKT